jgi:hypothetical protein
MQHARNAKKLNPISQINFKLITRAFHPPLGRRRALIAVDAPSNLKYLYRGNRLFCHGCVGVVVRLESSDLMVPGSVPGQCVMQRRRLLIAVQTRHD